MLVFDRDLFDSVETGSENFGVHKSSLENSTMSSSDQRKNL